MMTTTMSRGTLLAKSRQPRNNALRLLNGQDIAHTVHTFPATIHAAPEVADHLGVPRGRVFKTLVALAETPRAKPILAMVPATGDLDLKALARAVGEKKVSMATQRDAERLTGLKVGGIGALALRNRGFRCVLDETAVLYDAILVSAGQRGLNVELPVDALQALTDAVLAPISREGVS